MFNTNNVCGMCCCRMTKSKWRISFIETVANAKNNLTHIFRVRMACVIVPQFVGIMIDKYAIMQTRTLHQPNHFFFISFFSRCYRVTHKNYYYYRDIMQQTFETPYSQYYYIFGAHTFSLASMTAKHTTIC